MVISHSKEFIFIWIWKTAGTSIFKSLKRLIEIEIKEEQCNYGKHSTALYNQKYHSQIFKDYWSFTFVRNPWDWQVSQFFFTKQYKKHLWREWMMQFDNVEDLIKKRYELITSGKWKANKQKDWICNKKGEIIINEIFKFEKLEEAWLIIEDKLNLKHKELIKTNISKERKYADYHNYYTEETAQMVAELWKEDIELFDYSF